MSKVELKYNTVCGWKFMHQMSNNSNHRVTNRFVYRPMEKSNELIGNAMLIGNVILCGLLFCEMFLF